MVDAGRDNGELAEGGRTFLLTDVEGSTRLWEQQPAEMAAALARHDSIVATAVQRRGGELVRERGEGDSSFSAFRRPVDAVSCALEIQQALHQEPWPDGIALLVRMALHSGEATLRAGDYYGQTVNRCARLRAAAHGGQVVLSRAVAAQTRGSLPPGASLQDLGVHRLKDLSDPEHVHQLCHPSLPHVFPPLRSLNSRNHNLPPQLTSFIGREREMAEVSELLGSHRLLTLTGAGGCGKSRLALQVAADRADVHPGGIWLVELAALTDPLLVPQALFSALGLRQEPGRLLMATLVDHLVETQCLIVLDNCEHLVQACADLVQQLLAACPDVRVLATSRQVLGLPGEAGWRVPSLSLPTTGSKASLEELAATESARLFVDRARAVAPAFELGDQDVAPVHEICTQLDGIPLAIELAAARIGVLAPGEVAARLFDRFHLLTGGSRSSLPRQQTLQAAVDWSHDLLSEPERVLLRRLGVFAGGWTLPAAEAVCANGGVTAAAVLDLLTELASKSLVLAIRQGDSTRYHMLETIRQYGRERLREAGEEGEVSARHCQWGLGLAEDAEQELLRGRQVSWQRLESEHDNLRAALEWSLEDPGGVESALRLAGALGEFWDLRCYFEEGRRWLEAALGREDGAWPAARAKALNSLGLVVSHQGDYRRARTFFEEALRLARRTGELQVVSTTLGNLGWMDWSEGKAAAGRSHLEEGVDLAREVGDKWLIARALYLLTHVEATENPDRAVELAEESLHIARVLGEKSIEGRSEYFLGLVSMFHANYQSAREHLQRSVALAREVGDRWQAPWSLSFLGMLELLSANFEAARPILDESLEMARETGNMWCVARCLGGLAWTTLFLEGDPPAAMALAQESLGISEEIGTLLDTAIARSFLAESARARHDLDEAERLHRQALDENMQFHNLWGIATSLERLARLDVDRERFDRAAHLLGLAAAVRQTYDIPLPPLLLSEYEVGISMVREAIGEPALEAAMAEAASAALASGPGSTFDWNSLTLPD